MTHLIARTIILCFFVSLILMLLSGTIFAPEILAGNHVSLRAGSGNFGNVAKEGTALFSTGKDGSCKVSKDGKPTTHTTFAEPTAGMPRRHRERNMAVYRIANNTPTLTRHTAPLRNREAGRSARKRSQAAGEASTQEGDDGGPAPAQGCEPLRMAVKTNLLYDALTVPNIGAEFYLGNGWSAAAGAAYSWWSNSPRHRYLRIYGGDIAIRKWFGARAKATPLTGHHIGIYGQLFTYDIEFGGKGYMGGKPGGKLWDNPQAAAGLEYGYSIPIARRLNIDFVAGAGYWYGKTREYKPANGHYVWLHTKQRKYFGPTKAEVSIVWLLGRGYARKGGNR